MAVPTGGQRITPSDRHVGLAWGESEHDGPMFEGTFRQCCIWRAGALRANPRATFAWFYRGRWITYVWCGHEWREQNELEFYDGVAYVRTE